MKERLLSLPLLALAILLVCISSCKKENENVTNISSYGSTTSHHMGADCVNCHYNGGDGKGWFTLAGTAYDSATITPFPNVIVKLYTGPNGTGTLKYTLDGDANGNFYTTDKIDFVGGLFPSVMGLEFTRYMPDAVITGRCNSCHGVSVHRIFAN
jgi:hypothetical protein